MARSEPDRLKAAFAYLDEVKRTFSQQPERCDAFVEILEGYEAERLDAQGVVSKVSLLLRGCNMLILGFNEFLPASCKIQIEDIEEINTLFDAKMSLKRGAQNKCAAGQLCMQGKDASSYSAAVQKRFAASPIVYTTFVAVMNAYETQQCSNKDMLDQVINLFADHPDLLRDLVRLLPPLGQSEARERLNRAAIDSEMRTAAELAFGTMCIH